jgi:hypothetical protein
MDAQRAAVHHVLAEWQGNGDQTDDMLLIGIRA